MERKLQIPPKKLSVPLYGYNIKTSWLIALGLEPSSSLTQILKYVYPPKGFHTRTRIMVSQLAKIPTLFPNWCRRDH